MPVLARPWIVGSAVAYLLVVVGIGVWSVKRTRTPRDFFIAGQRLGVVVAGLATMSAAFSGFVFLGGPGLTYRIGLASLFINAPVGFTAGLLCWVLGKRLRLLAEVREVFTIPDAIAARFGSRWATALAAMAIVVGTLGYLGVQIQALGVVIEAIFGTRSLFGPASPAVAMAIGVAVVLFYSVAGGMVAGVYTDLFQGALMVLAAVAVFAYALSAGGGLPAITRSIAASPSFGDGFLEPVGRVPATTALGFFFIFGVGVLGQPHMLHKLYMLKDPGKLRHLPLVLGGSQVLCLLLWLGIGLAVPALVAQGRLAPLVRPDDAAPVFLLRFVPEALAGLVFAGVLAAIMSTADSFLSIGSAALVRDLPRALGWRLADELSWGRVATVAVAVGAAVFAYLYDDLIALLGTFAFGTFAAALAPALAVGLNWSRVTGPAATASIATGMAVNLGLELLARTGSVPGLPRATGALPAAVALAASFIVLLVVSGATRKRSDALDPDIRLILEM